MKQIFCAAFILSFLLFPQCENAGNKKKENNLTVLELKGDAYARGFVHGKTLKPQINTILQRWKKELETNFHQGFDVVIQTFFEKTTIVDSITKYCPDLLEEVRGIASGSEQDFKVMLALQVSEEIEWAGRDFLSSNCTSMSFSGKSIRPTIVAQNMDPPLFLHGFPTLLHITDKNTGNESYVYTFPGFIGLCGMSENVAVTCNGISMLTHRIDGIPVAFILRTLLQCNNETEAFQKVCELKHATPQCYTIGGNQEAKCFECSANSVVEFYPYENQNVTLHTNFAAANADFSAEYIELLSKYGKTTSDPYFCPRYFLLYDKIKDLGFDLNAENIKSLLSLTEPVAHPISNQWTYGSLIMEMGERPTLYLAPGKPHHTEYLTFQLTGNE